MPSSPVAALAAAQLRHLKGRWALLAAGIALVIAVPVLTAGLSRAVTDRTIRRTVAGFDLTDRTLLVTQEAGSTFVHGTPAQSDARVRAGLATLTSGPIVREVLFHQLTAKGSTFFLGAADELGRSVRLTAGRLPRTCTPSHCEVVRLGGAAALDGAAATLGLDVVGVAVRTNPLLVSGSQDPAGEPVLLGADVAAMTRLAALDLFDRHYLWVAPIDPARVIALGVSAYVRRGADLDTALDERVGATTFLRPDDAIQATGDRARVSTRRFGLLGGFAAVLLLGFAVVAGIGLRRETAVLVTLLRRRGATPEQVGGVVVLEAVLGALAGAALGVIVGGAVAAAERHGTDLSPLAAAGHALDSAWPSATLLLVASTAVLVGVLLWPDAQARAVWRLLDLVALACLGAAALAGARGSASSSTLASGGDPIVVALPVLASVVAGLLAARLWQPTAAVAARLLPRRSVAGRLALLGSLRRPLRPVATVAFLTAAIASVVFAGAYRATLLASNADQAAYQVPLDATLSASPDQPVPAAAVDERALAHQRVTAYGVLRTNATVTLVAGASSSVNVLAIDHGGIAAMHRFTRTTGSAVDAQSVANRLATPVLAGRTTLPAGTTRVSVVASGYDRQTTVTMTLADDRSIDLRPVAGGLAGSVAGGALPAASAISAITINEAPDYATHHAHAVGEGSTDQPALAGVLTFGAVSANGAITATDWTGWGSLHATISAQGTSLRIAYKIVADPAVAVPNYEVARGYQVPIVVDKQTAGLARGGALSFAVQGTTTLAGRVVGVLARLPTVGGAFILADRAALDLALSVQQPGQRASEVWLSGTTAALDHALATAPYDEMTITRRGAVQDGLDHDPVGEGSRLLLIIVALLALAVAAVALVLLVVGERRDGAAELYAWEADGLAPRLLRRLLAVRAIAVAAIAVPVGVVAGLIVARVGADLVSIDASGNAPTPPLEVTLGSLWTPLALVIGVGAGLVLGIGVALVSLRERLPVAATVDLR
jgi:hypothetical protein